MDPVQHLHTPQRHASLVQFPHILDRTGVSMSTIDEIVYQRKYAHRSINQDAPIHADGIRVLGLGEEAQYQEDDEDDLGNDVDGQTVFAKTEFGWQERRTGQTTPEHAADAGDVGREESAQGEGCEGIKCYR